MEVADSLAKNATSNFRSHIKIPYPDNEEDVKVSLEKQFQAYLEAAARYLPSQCMPLYTNALYPFILGIIKKTLTREEVVLVNRIRSNHYNLNFSLHRKKHCQLKRMPLW